MTISFKDTYTYPASIAEGFTQDLESIRENTYVGNSILSVLGSYWQHYYADVDTLHHLSGAVTPLVGEEFQALLHQVLTSSIIDTPVHYTKQYELFAFNSDDATYVYTDESETTLAYIEFTYPGLEGIEYLSSGLFNASIVLDAGNYFEVVPNSGGTIRFYIDIFQDADIKSGAYVFETTSVPDKSVYVAMLWASTITVTETYLYDRFGRYLYSPENNSDSYLAVLTALQYFFTNTKTVGNLESVLNILFRLPFSRNFGETVLTIDTLNAAGSIIEGAIDYDANATADTQEDIQGLGWYYRITTDQNIYFAPLYADLLVAVGDRLSKYQLLSRLNTAQDYISNPGWYDDSKFPFELVHHLDDYTLIDTPPEFEPYRPHFFNGVAQYDGDYFYTGEFATYNGINPFLGTRSKSDGSTFEQHLYGLMDSILKYNLIYLYTELNYENVDYYADNQIAEAYTALTNGVPTYLYPVIETVFKSRLIDKFDDLEDVFEPGVTVEADPDRVMVCPQRSYNGDVGYSNPLAFTYSGEFSYSLDAPRFYPFGGPEGFFHDCETELAQGSLKTSHEESISVLGIGEGEPTFPREQFYFTHSGVQNYGGAVGFTLQTEGFEESTVGIGFTDEEVVPAAAETAQSSVELQESFDAVGGHWGDVSFNNARPMVYGGDFVYHNTHGGDFTYGGAAGFHSLIDASLAIQFNGGRSYSGFTDYQMTYGANVPTINIQDTLEVNLTYAPS